MLTYSYKNLLASTPAEAREYSFKDARSGEQKSGTSYSATLTLLGEDNQVALCRLKGKSLDEVKEKLGAYALGKPGKIHVRGDVVGGVVQLTA